MRKFLAAAALAVATPAFAIPTGMGSFTAPLPGTKGSAEPGLAGSVVNQKIVSFSAPKVSGTVEMRTVRTADGFLTFSWKINVAADSTDEVQSIAFKGFKAVVYNANWRSDALGDIAPTAVRGWFDGGGFPSPSMFRLSFDFARQVRRGESSRYFFLQTHRPDSAAATGVITFRSGAKVEIPTLAPVG